MVLGTALLIGALSLFLYNQNESDAAGEAAAQVMPVIVQRIQENVQEREESSGESSGYTGPVPNTPLQFLTPEDKKMTETVIDGDAYIGYLSIPALSLELPVMADWSYSKLNKAPCRFTGTLRGEDLVIMAHNYWRHFGQLSELKLDDEVIFVDMDGVTTKYRVVATDILGPDAKEEMTSGEYDLTLFTCTYGGENRVTVRCDMD